MAEKPILFSTEMVKAILEGRKTMTRRIIKSRHESGLYRVCRRVIDNAITSIESLDWDERNCEKDITCRWQAGDHLWVRESFKIMDYWPDQKAVHVIYSDASTAICDLTDREWQKFSRWKEKDANKPSLFLFKSMARIWLQVTDIRVEGLQDISEEDAVAEGIEPIYCDDCDELIYLHRSGEGHLDERRMKSAFKNLWGKINDPESWQSNPFVFAISFKILSTGRAGEGKN